MRMKMLSYGVIAVSLLVIVLISCSQNGGPLAPTGDGNPAVAAKVTGGPPDDRDIRVRVFIHYPHPTHEGQCDLTVNETNTWGATGWTIPSTGVTYKVNVATIPSAVGQTAGLTAIHTGFATWTATDPDKKFTDGGTTSLKSAKRDGTNLIAWGGTPFGAIAVTTTWYYSSTGQWVESDVIFNKRFAWSYTSYPFGDPHADCAGVAGTYDAQNIATHEFGHIIGLDDLYADADKDLTMYGYGAKGELKKDTLGLGDITGVTTLAP